MVAGFERYFQIVRCYRDEDLRADRQPEFTQLDLEMSFVSQDDILDLIEAMIAGLVPAVTPQKHVLSPFPRLTYAESMARFGTDKPDLRFGLELIDLSEIVAQSGFGVFKNTVAEGGQVKGLCVPGCAGCSRRELGELEEMVKKAGAGGLVWMAVEAEGLRSPVAKYLEKKEPAALIERLGAQTGDLLLIDRLVAFLANEESIREVIAFPKTNQATDPMMGAPSTVGQQQLQELHIRVVE